MFRMLSLLRPFAKVLTNLFSVSCIGNEPKEFKNHFKSLEGEIQLVYDADFLLSHTHQELRKQCVEKSQPSQIRRLKSCPL